MGRRDIVIGILFLGILSGVFLWRQRINNKVKEELKVPQTLSIEDQIENKFKLRVPEDVDKAELKDDSGGNASALATRKFENFNFELNILADLPDLPEASFYQAWLSKGEEEKGGYSLISLGKLTAAKGGWILNFTSQVNYSDYNNILVSQEKTFDKILEKKILIGNF